MPVNTIARPASSAASITPLIVHRAAGLDHCRGAGFGHRQQTVGERKEGFRSRSGTNGARLSPSRRSSPRPWP